MSKLSNKIDANDRKIAEVLENKKYTVDYFQREYNWQKKHIEQLVNDLTSAFLNEYTSGDRREEGENYNNYYLGPFVVSDKSGQRSIIDGQQRLTSITLLLIYLNNLQNSLGLAEKIESLIFSEHRGSKSFNIQVPEREVCFDSLFRTGAYLVRVDDSPSTVNMTERYNDIAEVFPEEIGKDATVLAFFIDWLKYNVVLVEIVAHSDENAYTIFETMNDRGLNLTPTEMLKGFLLSRFSDPARRIKANHLWNESIVALKAYDPSEDQTFFQAWLRASYADTIRPGKAGSQNEDFEKIGTRFHSWVRDNLKKVGLAPEAPETFERFFDGDFRFFHRAYLRIHEGQTTLIPGLEHVYYVARWGIATSQSYSLMLAPLSNTDTPAVVDAKMDLVARYIETFTVRRGINFRKFAASSIRYTMYSLVKEIRGKNLVALRALLAAKVAAFEDKWTAMEDFCLHGQNRKFIKFLLSRITAYVEQGAGMATNFQTYHESPGGRPFEIEHIWANDLSIQTEKFEDNEEFEAWRDSLGALILLPNGTNQSYQDKPYGDKLPHYQKANLLAQSLCALTYQNNPNFTKWFASLNHPFRAHPEFKTADILARQALYQKVCEAIWKW